MGLGDLQRRVTTVFAADISQMQTAQSQLTESSKSFGESVFEASKKANEGLNSLFDSVTALSGKFEGLKKVGEFMWEGYIDSIQDAKNATASFGVSIEGLTRASHGLVTENDLLAFSAKAMHSAYGNTQEDMETAEKLVVLLTRRNVDLGTAQKLVTDAFVEGKTRGLEPYGIVIDRHIKGLAEVAEGNETVAQKMEIHNRILKASIGLTKEVKDGQDEYGEAVQRSITGAHNAWDDMKKSIGELTNAMAPAIDALASFASKIADVVNGLKSSWREGATSFIKEEIGVGVSLFTGGGPDLSGIPGASDPSSVSSVIAAAAARNTQLYSTTRDANVRKMQAGSGEIEMADDDLRPMIEARKKATEEWAKQAESLGEYNKTLAAALERDKSRLIAGFQYGGEYQAGLKSGLSKAGDPTANSSQFGFVSGLDTSLGHKADSGIDGINSTGFFDQTTQLDKLQAQTGTALTAKWNTQIEANKKNSFLERTFGKVSEFDAYKTAWQGLEGAATSAFDAMVTGQMSAGQALKQFTADFLKTTGEKMLIKALESTAAGIGELAGYNYPSAALYFESAAAYGAAAAAAGVASNLLGGGKGSSGGSGSSSSGSSSSSSSTSTNNAASTGPIIVYGDSFSDDSPRMRAIKADRMVRRALGSDAVSHS